VWRTRVGYAGGTSPAPTYRRIGDHMEALQVDFDPKQISYDELLDVFWKSHHPVRPAYKRQYASAIFTHDAEQHASALASVAGASDRYGAPPATEIAPFAGFTLAEDYHQKYRLRSAPFLDAVFRAIYPQLGDYVSSSATMRVNAWLDGEGAPVDAELDVLGLDAAGRRLLETALGR